MQISYKKVIRELRIYLNRTLIALLGIIIAITSIGFVLSAYQILVREMDANYMNTNPASIVMKIPDLDEDAISLIQEQYPALELEARTKILARINRENGTYGTIYLYGICDFEALKVDTFSLESGKYPSAIGEVALERDSLSNLPFLKEEGKKQISLMIPGQKEQVLQFSGLTHAPGLSPASMEKYSYGFLTLEGMKALGYQGWFDELHIVSYENRMDKEKMTDLAKEIRTTLERAGYDVKGYEIPKPGKHPHADQLSSLIFLLQTFTMISLVIAGIIIINLWNFIMSTQTKQIGIMKTMGASLANIALPYLAYVVIISVFAILISIPISLKLGGIYSDFAASVLNFKIYDYSVPLQVYLVLIAAGIGIPLMASFIPIYRSCQKSILECINDTSATRMNKKRESKSRKSGVMGTFSKLIVSNVFRKKSRTILAILALSSGGVLFMSARNISASIDNTTNQLSKTFRYDYDLRLQGEHSQQTLEQAIAQLPQIKDYEIYEANRATFENPNGINSGTYLLRALSSDSQMIRFDYFKQNVKQTKSSEDEIEVVINKGLWEDEKWIQTGMQLPMKIGNQTVLVTIAGIVNEVPPLPSIYMNREDYDQIIQQGNKNLFLSTQSMTMDEALVFSSKIEKVFQKEGIIISENWNIALLRDAFVEHLKVILSFLSIVAALAVIVGGLSIASAVAISISERKREVGIMKACGAKTMQIAKMISLEVVSIGMISWLVGFVIAIPVSILTGNYFGQIFLLTNLDSVISLSGALTWLAIAVVISFLASFIPVYQSTISSLPEVLSYE